MHYLTETERLALRDRFGLHDGQFFGTHEFKNLHWFLVCVDDLPLMFNATDYRHFGYGDLRAMDILRIASELTAHEKFIGLWESWSFQRDFAYEEVLTSREIALVIDNEGFYSRRYNNAQEN